MSDVHCNVDAFDQAIKEMTPEVDEILLSATRCTSTASATRSSKRPGPSGLRYIQGNHEMVLLLAARGRARSAPTVDPGQCGLPP